MSIWHTPVSNTNPQLEISSALLSEAEIADIKARIPFDSAFVGGVRTTYGERINATREGRFRMVDPAAAEAAAKRRRQRKAEEFKQALAALEALQNYQHTVPRAIPLVRVLKKPSLLARITNNIRKILKGET